jgi:hypothetical protein
MLPLRPVFERTVRYGAGHGDARLLTPATQEAEMEGLQLKLGPPEKKQEILSEK